MDKAGLAARPWLLVTKPEKAAVVISFDRPASVMLGLDPSIQAI